MCVFEKGKSEMPLQTSQFKRGKNHYAIIVLGPPEREKVVPSVRADWLMKGREGGGTHKKDSAVTVMRNFN